MLLSSGEVWDVCAPGPQESEGTVGSPHFMGLLKKGTPYGTAWKFIDSQQDGVGKQKPRCQEFLLLCTG